MTMGTSGAVVRLGVVCCLFGLLIQTWALPNRQARAEAAGERTVCLDPGHQWRGNHEREPIGPGAKVTKAKVTSGTTGVFTKKPEYVVNLEASLLLRDRLEEYGYHVVMTREVHEVDLSNRERAQICNDAGADLSVRIHADGDVSPKAQGMTMLYPGVNEYTGGIHEESKRAAGLVLSEVIAATGAVSRGTVARSDLSGFNWSEVPSILVEMGFMSNPREDELFSDPDYLAFIAQGLAAGINRYLAEPAEGEEIDIDLEAQLSERTQLFELVDDRVLRTNLYLSPQTVHVGAVRGEWARIDTWLGERWIRYDGGPSGARGLGGGLSSAPDS